MANWASTSYVIEGPEKTLERIEQAILHHEVEPDSDEHWEGNTLKALGISWEPYRTEETEKGTVVPTGSYMRGFIYEDPWCDDNTGALRFNAEEAWGRTDFADILRKALPDIAIYWIVEEPNCEVYATNDKDGKYFPDRFYVDTCIDGEYKQKYFKTKEGAFKWLSDLTHSRVNSDKDVEDFNADYEDSGADDENYIYIHEFTVVD